MYIEPGVWDQSVGHSVLGIGKAISKKAYANSSLRLSFSQICDSIQLDFEIMEKLQLIQIIPALISYSHILGRSKLGRNSDGRFCLFKVK